MYEMPQGASLQLPNNPEALEGQRKSMVVKRMEEDGRTDEDDGCWVVRDLDAL
jgi:hypothetical protein